MSAAARPGRRRTTTTTAKALPLLFLYVSMGQSLLSSVGRRSSVVVLSPLSQSMFGTASSSSTTSASITAASSSTSVATTTPVNRRRPFHVAGIMSSTSSSTTSTAIKMTESMTAVAQNTTDEISSSSQVEQEEQGETSSTTTSSSSGGGDGKTVILADANDFIKPDRDTYDYRQIRLANNLEVLLVSTAKKGTSNPIEREAEEQQQVDNSSTTDNENHHSAMEALENETVPSTDIDDDTVMDGDVVVVGDDNDNNPHDSDVASSKTEAAAVHIQAGHFDDTIPGLAHFHEHMVFLGTEKYPGEDEYEGFLSKHGGFSNAYTDMEDTNYYFSVTTQQHDPNTVSEGLSGGLDRLAQFFIKPTFEESMVEREMRAIDSEYRNGKTSDSWRNFQLMKTVANPDHPFSNFGCGNYETLTSSQNGEPPVEELHKFWNTYYKTSNMKLTVVGSSTLDALQKSVEDTFGTIPHSNDPPRLAGKLNANAPFPRENAVYGTQQPAFGEEQIGKIREVIPLLESRTIKVQFVTPPSDDPVLKATRPHRVISHLLGHESPGSLHHLLNDAGYITGLSSGTTLDTSEFALFSLSLALTPKGMKAVNEVLDLVFGWIAIIKQTAMDNPGLMSKYHDELRQISATNFKFRENGDPTDFCSSAAELLFESDIVPGEILVSGSKSADYNPTVANAFLERLTPTNCMITVVNSDLTQDQADEWQVEPLYGAIYRERAISPEKVKEWDHPDKIHEDLHIPALNDFIPSDFSLLCDDEGKPLSDLARKASRLQPPSLVHESDNFRMWHKVDQHWRVPKTFIRLSIVTPTTYASPRAMSLSRIYQRVLNDDLNAVLYDASLSGCHYSISCVPNGYKLSVRGYSEKLPLLLDTLTSRMLTLIEDLKEGKDKQPGLYARFEKAKESLLRETKNYRLDTPYEIANYNSRLLMEQNVWYLDDYVDIMEGPIAEKNPLSMEECASVAEACLTGRLKADALCIGNIDEKGAREVTDVIEKHFLSKSTPLKDSETPRFKSMQLPTRTEAQQIFGSEVELGSVPIKYQELAFSPSEENNSVELTLQAGSDLSLGYEGIGILDLIGHLAYSSAYNQLRTREQLGYIVSVYTRKTAGGAWGLTCVVQSSSQSPEYLEGRIEEWLKSFREELVVMDANVMAMEARGVVMQLLEDNTKLSQEVATWWNEITATEMNHESMAMPAFDRIERLADELNPVSPGLPDTTMNGNPRKSPEDLKARVLEVFDRHYNPDSPDRRVMSSRVFSQSAKDEYEETLTKPNVFSSYSDMRYIKDYLTTFPVIPYWRRTSSPSVPKV